MAESIEKPLISSNVLDRGAAGTLILILPLAFALVILYTAWPFLLALFLLALAWKIWQHFQWKRWSRQVNPYFNQLIKENQGCLTATDLAMKANLTGGAARRFLDKKAEEYGAQRKTVEDKGTVYYFLTASALGSIFAQSEPPEAFEEEVATLPSSEADEFAPATEDEGQQNQAFTDEVATVTIETPQEEEQTETVEVELEEESPPTAETQLEEKEDTSSEKSETKEDASESLIQAELAKRLDVHSSTVGKRKSDPDFAEWSQNRDPNGIAWEYLDDERVFIPLADNPR